MNFRFVYILSLFSAINGTSYKIIPRQKFASGSQFSGKTLKIPITIDYRNGTIESKTVSAQIGERVIL